MYSALGINRVLLIGLIVFTPNALIADSVDEMCNELSKFTNSLEGKSDFIRLTTNWAEMEKGCAHRSTKAGINFYNWLIKNTSTEFQEFNIRRVLSCMGGNYTDTNMVQVEYITGKVRAYDVEGVTDKLYIELEYAVGLKDKLPFMKITVGR